MRNKKRWITLTLACKFLSLANEPSSFWYVRSFNFSEFDLYNTEMSIRPSLKKQCNINPLYTVYIWYVHLHHVNVCTNDSFFVGCLRARRKLQPSMKLRDGQTNDFYAKNGTYSTLLKNLTHEKYFSSFTRHNSKGAYIIKTTNLSNV